MTVKIQEEYVFTKMRAPRGGPYSVIMRALGIVDDQE